MDELTCTDYVDFGGCQDIFTQTICFKMDSNLLDLKLKFFKKDTDKVFPLVHNPTTEESDSNQIMQLRNQLVAAAECVGGKQTFPLYRYQ